MSVHNLTSFPKSNGLNNSIRIALAGNPNCGKTTVFNGYTGAHQHVGNYPGVTVDRKEGDVHLNGELIILVDLPGTYSLTAYSQEEIVFRNELSSGNVQAVINVVDVSALERNLLLTVQMLEMGMPVVLACNMMDEAKKAGIHIDMNKLQDILKIPVIPMVAKTGEGLQDALEAAYDLSKKGYREPLRLSYGSEIDEVILNLEKKIENVNALKSKYHPRWIAVKLIEGDSSIYEEICAIDEKLSQELNEICQPISIHVRQTLDTTMESIITDHRYGYIRSVLREDIVKQEEGKDRLLLSDALDKVLTNTFWGPLIMLGVLYLMYQITFEVGAYPQSWVEDGFALIGQTLNNILPDGLFRSLVVDGIIAGVGGVVSFVPLIIIMFALVSFMEDSGYMARMAYMMDRIFHFFGLHGASVMPYVVAGGIAGGCAIPGAMATRTLRSPKEKLATLLTLPYMLCGAKLPVLLMLTGAFFPENAPKVMFMLMVVGWVVALIVARLLRSTLVKGPSTPFVMELPPYRLPTLFSVLLHCFERAWAYLKKAGTVLVAISIIIWASMTFPQLPEDKSKIYEDKIATIESQIETLSEGSKDREKIKDKLDEVTAELSQKQLEYSIAGRLGKFIEPITQPAGFDWRTDIALLAGIAAKEAVIATMGTAWSLGEQDPEDAAPLSERLKAEQSWSKATALSLMLFVLLYSPCFVALVVIKNEAGNWIWVAFSMVFNTGIAYCIAVLTYKIGCLVWG